MTSVEYNSLIIGFIFNGVSSSPTIIGAYPISNFQMIDPLPAGLSIDSNNGDITGIPTGTAPLQVYRLSYESLGTKLTSLTLGIYAEFGLIYDFGNNVFIKNKVGSATPGNTTPAPFTILNVSINTLPAGLTINNTTGLISGTPTEDFDKENLVVSYESTYPPYLLITLTTNVEIQVVDEEDVIIYEDIDSFVDETINLSPTFIFNAGNYQNFSSPDLPSFLSIDSNTGVISGTPLNYLLNGSFTVNYDFFGSDATVYNLSKVVNINVLPSKTVIDTNLLLPIDNSNPSQTINLNTYPDKNQLINVLIDQNYLDNLVKFVRRIYANVQLTGVRREVSYVYIPYNCELKNEIPQYGLTIGNCRTVMNEVFSKSSSFGRLIDLIFEFGNQVQLKGMYLQKKLMIYNINLNKSS